ncbi:MAG: acyltransferase [Zoogloeaceae bacterium]|nr:acyltransferase [Zoogloeaceae bacterium]
MEYRPDIDGLRAIAVLAVVGFHAFPGRLPGGFIGVDVFFVISGYLISRIILQKLHEGRFSFLDFYAHRIRRIFPALIVVLAFSGAVGWFFLLPHEYQQLGKHMLAGAGFVENFVLFWEAGYFDVVSELKPLMHLWSLSIEEQFYLLHPLILWGAWRLRANIPAVLLVLLLFSFGYNVFGITGNPERVFFFPQSRFWELWAGALLAYLDLFHRKRLLRTRGKSGFLLHHSFLSLSGSLLILASIFILHRELYFPGWWAPLPVMGAFLLILAGPKGWVNKNLLSQKPVVFIGLISYPLYLWHWTLLSFSRILIEVGEMWTFIQMARVVIILCSIFLAWLTWRYLERPIRFGRKTKTRMALLIGGMITLLGMGFLIEKQEGFKTRVDENLARIVRAYKEWEYPGKMRTGKLDGISYHLLSSTRHATTLFIGDSNMEQYYSRVEELILADPENTNSAIFKTGPGCFPIMEMTYDKGFQHCNTLAADALQLARDLPQVESVVIAALWHQYLKTGLYTTKNIAPGTPDYQNALQQLSNYLKALVAIKKKVWVILTIPTGEKLSPAYMAERSPKNFPRVFRTRKQESGIERKSLDYDRIHADLARIAHEAGATVIDPAKFLCNEKRCEALDENGAPMYRDEEHLRPSFVRRRAVFIDPALR